MSIEGRLTIDLSRAATDGVRIASSRPFHIVDAFRGRAPADIVRLLPVLFNVCSTAQAAASVAACERALGLITAPQTERLRRFLVDAETAREHVLRIAMDWPSFVDADPCRNAITGVMRLFQKMRGAADPANEAFDIAGSAAIDRRSVAPHIEPLRHLLASDVFAEPVDQWMRRRSFDDLKDWAAAGNTVAQNLIAAVIARDWNGQGGVSAVLLPEQSNRALAERLFGTEADAFVRAPEWHGGPCETGTLSRQARQPLIRSLRGVHGDGILTRLAARLVELAGLPARLDGHCKAASAYDDSAGQQMGDQEPMSGTGLAQVEAARGRLVHAVALDGDVVGRYRILAPTEWNFHPSGTAARGLGEIAMSPPDGRDECADLFVRAVDPCVGYELRMS